MKGTPNDAPGGSKEKRLRIPKVAHHYVPTKSCDVATKTGNQKWWSPEWAQRINQTVGQCEKCLTMKPIVSVFSFSHWGSTQLTNERAKKVACFIFTNTWTYILYKLFGSIFTIKYILQSKNPSKRRVCSFLKDLWATWPISKSETPRGFQKNCLRHGAWDVHSMFLLFGSWRSLRSTTYAALPSTHSYVFYLNLSCIPFIQKRQLVDPVAFIWCHHALSYPSTHDCYLLI